MSVAHEVRTGTLAAAGTQPAPTVAKTHWWERPAIFRYGFVALI